jgi:hypothetical protein
MSRSIRTPPICALVGRAAWMIFGAGLRNFAGDHGRPTSYRLPRRRSCEPVGQRSPGMGKRERAGLSRGFRTMASGRRGLLRQSKRCDAGRPLADCSRRSPRRRCLRVELHGLAADKYGLAEVPRPGWFATLTGSGVRQFARASVRRCERRSHPPASVPPRVSRRGQAAER